MSSILNLATICPLIAAFVAVIGQPLVASANENVVSLHPRIKCERLLIDFEKYTEENRKILDRNLKDDHQWRRFITPRALKPAAFQRIGLSLDAINRMAYLTAAFDFEHPELIEGSLSVRQNFRLSAQLENGQDDVTKELKRWPLTREYEVAWISDTAKLPRHPKHLGYVWPDHRGQNFYLEIEPVTVAGNPKTMVQPTRYSFGFEVECADVSRYTSDTHIEKVRTRNGLRCRIQVLRFIDPYSWPQADPADAKSLL